VKRHNAEQLLDELVFAVDRALAYKRTATVPGIPGEQACIPWDCWEDVMRVMDRCRETPTPEDNHAMRVLRRDVTRLIHQSRKPPTPGWADAYNQGRKHHD
jgi:hypothetical protein